MYFDEEFINSLPDDWAYAVLKIVTRFDKLMKLKETKAKGQDDIIKEVQLLLTVFCRMKRPKYKVPNLVGIREVDSGNVTRLLESLRNGATKHIKGEAEKKKLKHYKNVFEIALENIFHYEFSEGDLKRIQDLLNELRNLISTSEEFEPRHKQHLLGKLEKLQSELHKKVSDLDRFWGFFVDASIVVGRMGENAKPMVDVIQKVLRIIWPTQTRAYELSSDLPFKLLGQPEGDKSEDGES